VSLIILNENSKLEDKPGRGPAKTALAKVGRRECLPTCPKRPPARDNLALAIAPKDADVLFRAAVLYNHFGDTDKTLKFLSRAVEAGISRTEIRDTPDFERLWNDPRFRELLPTS